jgi:hypothetical protein
MKALQGVVAAAMIFGGGCAMFQKGSETPLQASSALPASEGKAIVSDGPNGNTALRVKVKHLAEPQKVAQGSRVYVVWVQPTEGRPHNVGVMQIDDELEGSLSTITPFKSFKVMVTPEASATVTSPTNDEVFTAQVNR